jgi:6-methylsalicylate decarboxylase
MLSNIPRTHSTLHTCNDYATSIVRHHPSGFGLLAALPTDNPEACLKEISCTTTEYIPPADGFTLSTVYNGIWFSNRSPDPVWEELNARSAVIHVHPDASQPELKAAQLL